MARRVKEFLQIDALSTLDDLIGALVEARDALPLEAEAELSLRGCDTFGRHISIAYMRPQTDEEVAMDARSTDAVARLLRRQDEEREAAKHRGRTMRLAA